MEYRTIRMAPPPPPSESSPVVSGEALLTSEECRVLGCLVEKAVTTPDYYPLTLNALVAACNQKTSRDPVVAYADDDVLAAIDGLKEKRLAVRMTGADARVPRYRHLMPDGLRLNRAETAALTLLLLRGAQTVGEIRGRSERLYEFESTAEVEETLRALAERSPKPLAFQLPRRPGEKEPRWVHLLSGEPPEPGETAVEPMRARGGSEARVAALEADVAALRDEIAGLRTEFERFRQQFS